MPTHSNGDDELDAIIELALSKTIVDEPSDVKNLEDNLRQLIHSRDEQREWEEVRTIELQVRANTYYEAADWCHEDPRYYKHFIDKRKEALQAMASLTQSPKKKGGE